MSLVQTTIGPSAAGCIQCQKCANDYPEHACGSLQSTHTMMINTSGPTCSHPENPSKTILYSMRIVVELLHIALRFYKSDAPIVFRGKSLLTDGDAFTSLHLL
uniref:Uncharacterized protein n=1 Tax=Eutreptiella gymnastica TaxID=73025 RepID=A0A7S1JDX7_9EUGL